MPDPFGSYIRNLDPSEILPGSGDPMRISTDVGLGHIEDPDMQSLMQREIAR